MKEKFKIFTIFLGCLLFRLLPLRAPNVEPVMSSIMPISRKYGSLTSFSFGFLSIAIYDLFTNFGIWTLITGFAYGIIGLFSYLYFQKHKNSTPNILFFIIISTVAYDLFTGVLFAPMWGMNIGGAFLMQVPFTILHLAGNLGFAFTLSPILNKWLVSENLVFNFSGLSSKAFRFKI